MQPSLSPLQGCTVTLDERIHGRGDWLPVGAADTTLPTFFLSAFLILLTVSELLFLPPFEFSLLFLGYHEGAVSLHGCFDSGLAVGEGRAAMLPTRIVGGIYRGDGEEKGQGESQHASGSYM